MRKVLAVATALTMVLIGFMAMVTPVVASCAPPLEPGFSKTMTPQCPYPDPEAIPLGTYVEFVLQISFVNGDSAVTDVYIKDRLGGELQVDDDTISASHSGLVITRKGATEKVFIDWYIGYLGPNDQALLTMKVYTDFNPGGNQEYTSLGTYDLNSGAVLKYVDTFGEKHSESTGSISITVVEA